jgi:hypothetical protein
LRMAKRRPEHDGRRRDRYQIGTPCGRGAFYMHHTWRRVARLRIMPHLVVSIRFTHIGSPAPVEVQSQPGPNPEFVACREKFGYPTVSTTNMPRIARTNAIPKTSPSLRAGHGHFIVVV